MMTPWTPERALKKKKAELALKKAQEDPYDKDYSGENKPDNSWFYTCARAVAADLLDRSRIKHEFDAIDPETRSEIVEALGNIIAHCHWHAREWDDV